MLHAMANKLLRQCYSTCLDAFACGEFVLVEDTKSRQRLIRLKEGGVYHSHRGHVTHTDILNLSPGQPLTTSHGTILTVKRPSLWEYVLLMRRGPTPSYPKDIWAILGLLDVHTGHTVLEAGSGSGALTLFLSRSVGSSGCVYSFENSQEHLASAVTNYNNWRQCHELTHPGAHWQDNVMFVNDSVANVTTHVQTPLDAVVLDLVDPTTVLHGILPLLKPGTPLVAYLPNVSQTMSLAAYCDRSPIQLLSVREVVHRLWTVKPAERKHGRTDKQSDDCSIPKFIARPSHNQQPHTGFLAHMMNQTSERELQRACRQIT